MHLLGNYADFLYGHLNIVVSPRGDAKHAFAKWGHGEHAELPGFARERRISFWGFESEELYVVGEFLNAGHHNDVWNKRRSFADSRTSVFDYDIRHGLLPSVRALHSHGR